MPPRLRGLSRGLRTLNIGVDAGQAERVRAALSEATFGEAADKEDEIVAEQELEEQQREAYLSQDQRLLIADERLRGESLSQEEWQLVRDFASIQGEPSSDQIKELQAALESVLERRLEQQKRVLEALNVASATGLRMTRRRKQRRRRALRRKGNSSTTG